MPFASYLKQTEPETYSKLIYSAFGAMPSQRRRKEDVKDDRPALPPDSPFVDGELIPITANHPLARAGLDVCKSRKIRPDVFEKWYVCLEGNQFLHRDANGNLIINPETGKPVGNEYRNRIIMPFYHFGGKWTQFDARAIDKNNPMRYLNLKNVRREAYNIDFIRFDQPFYVLEGTIDSTFIPNAIGIGGVQHLREILMDNPKIAQHKENCVFIWDNDEAGRTGRTATCHDGYKWFDWDGIMEKDINGEVLHGCNLPLGEDGYVQQECIDARTRQPGGSDILFMLKYGNVAKEKFKASMKNRREANARREAAITPETYF